MMVDKKATLQELGYSDFFADNRKSDNNSELIPARVIAEHKELYVVRTEAAQFSAKITGKMMHQALFREDYPAVGDWVLIKALSDGQAHIYEILPRKAILKRKSPDSSDAQIIATNIDIAFIVQAPDHGYNLNRFERYFAMAKAGQIKPVIVLNKADLISDAEREKIFAEIKSRFPDTDIHATSAATGMGIDELKKTIQKGLTYCFIGSSGVGKSSIINALLGEARLKTGEISDCGNRGRHVTVHRELFLLEGGGLLIDNPGLREIGLLDSSAGVEDVFADIYELARSCRFSDCTHQHEKGCAVLEALDNGTLNNGKYDNYMKLRKEDEYNSMSKLEKRQKDRKFGKFIKGVKKQLKLR